MSRISSAAVNKHRMRVADILEKVSAQDKVFYDSYLAAARDFPDIGAWHTLAIELQAEKNYLEAGITWMVALRLATTQAKEISLAQVDSQDFRQILSKPVFRAQNAADAFAQANEPLRAMYLYLEAVALSEQIISRAEGMPETNESVALAEELPACKRRVGECLQSAVKQADTLLGEVAHARHLSVEDLFAIAEVYGTAAEYLSDDVGWLEKCEQGFYQLHQKALEVAQSMEGESRDDMLMLIDKVRASMLETDFKTEDALAAHDHEQERANLNFARFNPTVRTFDQTVHTAFPRASGVVQSGDSSISATLLHRVLGQPGPVHHDPYSGAFVDGEAAKDKADMSPR